MPEFQATAKETGMGAVWMNADETAAYVEQSQKKAFALIDQLIADGLLQK